MDPLRVGLKAQGVYIPGGGRWSGEGERGRLQECHTPGLGRLAGHKPRAGKRLPGFRTPGLERLAGHTPRAGGKGKRLQGRHTPAWGGRLGTRHRLGLGGGRGTAGEEALDGQSRPVHQLLDLLGSLSLVQTSAEEDVLPPEREEEFEVRGVY